MWPESSSVKAVNLVKKSVTITEIDCFFIGTPCNSLVTDLGYVYTKTKPA